MDFCSDNDCSNRPEDVVAFCNTKKTTPECSMINNSTGERFVISGNDAYSCSQEAGQDYFILKENNLPDCVNPNPGDPRDPIVVVPIPGGDPRDPVVVDPIDWDPSIDPIGDDDSDEPVNLCGSQRDFNRAVWRSRRFIRRRLERKYRSHIMVYSVVYLVFMIWAVFLAMQTPPESRVTNIALAIVLGPIFVIAFYLNLL
jgi:hypothetical protein